MFVAGRVLIFLKIEGRYFAPEVVFALMGDNCVSKVSPKKLKHDRNPSPES